MTHHKNQIMRDKRINSALISVYYKDELEEIWKKRREKKEEDNWEKYKKSLPEKERKEAEKLDKEF